MMLGCVECTRKFIRWMNGTCKQPGARTEAMLLNPVELSFYPDIIAHPEVAQAVQDASATIRENIRAAQRYLVRWKRYRAIWVLDKDDTVHKWEMKVLKKIGWKRGWKM